MSVALPVPLPGGDVTNHGAEVLTFGAYGSGFGMFGGEALPLVLRPGVTWVERGLSGA